MKYSFQYYLYLNSYKKNITLINLNLFLINKKKKKLGITFLIYFLPNIV